jgi:glycosyltransferase involved in cell wall biosynthesis
LTQLQVKLDNIAFLAIGKMPESEFQELQKKSPNLPLISTGFIHSKEVAAHLQVLNLYLMLEPTHSLDQWNGSSTRSGTLAAALHLGIPVLGSRGELNDQFFDQIQMTLLEKLDEETIVEAVLAISDHYKHYAILAQKASEQAHLHLSWSSNTEKLLELIKLSPTL